MKNNKTLQNYLLSSALALTAVTMIVSCKDKNENEEPSVYTSAATAAPDTTKINALDPGAAGMPDTATVMNATAATTTNKAVINPKKKGGKGKTVVIWRNIAPGTKYEIDKEGIYNYAEVMPSFPGGQKALEKFIEDNITYPQEALDEGVEGVVYVQFAVDEAGKVYTPQLKSDKLGYGLDEEALKVVQKMPRWNPGRIKGKNVKSRFELPISYQIL
ncbi:energy transducer TonB [Sediminibacterium ginsengisoli]|uniref:TonB family C-terminal domain-containing protein n=1 Tax=Sediminibacterium ginsengisoli TaxID=413434 RepID=A0A1T4Q0S0_9BACT|nr:energy transducer TonB [Sediminibacterium ginsengisoli]SJZ97420.1 TonB family C-terminal domain-containing protein [Sediminibacterium ginsengisoli]